LPSPSLSNGAILTASGKTSFTSCAIIPMSFVLSVLKILFSQLKVTPFNVLILSKAFGILVILFFNLLSDAFCVKAPYNVAHKQNSSF
jgi:hypothetical protein